MPAMKSPDRASRTRCTCATLSGTNLARRAKGFVGIEVGTDVDGPAVAGLHDPCPAVLERDARAGRHSGMPPDDHDTTRPLDDLVGGRGAASELLLVLLEARERRVAPAVGAGAGPDRIFLVHDVLVPRLGEPLEAALRVRLGSLLVKALLVRIHQPMATSARACSARCPT